jgi:hypothetical protein
VAGRRPGGMRGRRGEERGDPRTQRQPQSRKGKQKTHRQRRRLHDDRLLKALLRRESDVPAAERLDLWFVIVWMSVFVCACVCVCVCVCVAYSLLVKMGSCARLAALLLLLPAQRERASGGGGDNNRLRRARAPRLTGCPVPSPHLDRHGGVVDRLLLGLGRGAHRGGAWWGSVCACACCFVCALPLPTASSTCSRTCAIARKIWLSGWGARWARGEAVGREERRRRREGE